MIKKTLFSLVAGAALTALLSAAPVVEAACQGYCADKQISNGCTSDFAGCSMHYDANGNLEDVNCFYVNTCEMEVY